LDPTIRSLVSMDDAIVAVRERFLALHRGEFEMPTHTALREVFKSVGVAMQDWAIAHLLAQRCLAD